MQEPNLAPEVVLYFVAARLFGPQVLHPKAETFEDALARLKESEPEEEPEPEDEPEPA